MCFPSSNSATQAAQTQASNQQATIAGSIANINAAYGNRQSQYDSYLKALNTSYQQQLNTQQAAASRGLKFSLARGGLTGSSVAANQGAELQKEMGQGTLTAAEQAQAKLAGLQSSDIASKEQMMSLATSGAQIGNAGQQMGTMLQANLNNAQSALAPNTLGNVFGGITGVASNMNTAAQTRLGLRAAQAYANPFSNATSTAGGYGGGPLG